MTVSMPIKNVDANAPESHEAIRELKSRHPEAELRPVLGKTANKRIEVDGLEYSTFLSAEIRAELRTMAREEAHILYQEEQKKRTKKLDIDHFHLKNQTDIICKRILLDVCISTVIGASWRDEVSDRNRKIIAWFTNVSESKLSELHLQRDDLAQLLSGSSNSLRSELNAGVHKTGKEAEACLSAWIRDRSITADSLFGRMFFSVYGYHPKQHHPASAPHIEEEGSSGSGLEPEGNPIAIANAPTPTSGTPAKATTGASSVSGTSAKTMTGAPTARPAGGADVSGPIIPHGGPAAYSPVAVGSHEGIETEEDDLSQFYECFERF